MAENKTTMEDETTTAGK